MSESREAVLPPRPLRVLSLFSGNGGMDRGLENAGLQVIAQAEVDEFCVRVLGYHWNVPNYGDVTTADWNDLRGKVDVIAGGFPCPPFSDAGLRKGMDDDRWMWPDFERAIRMVRPGYVIVENVAGLIRFPDAFGRILADLSALGFDAEWSVLSCCALGAAHTRERVFIVANANGKHGEARMGVRPLRPGTLPAFDDRPRTSRDPAGWFMEAAAGEHRSSDGFSNWNKRLRGLGNAVAPPVGEYVGRMIVEAA